jgi:hypothetical protein
MSRKCTFYASFVVHSVQSLPRCLNVSHHTFVCSQLLSIYTYIHNLDPLNHPFFHSGTGEKRSTFCILESCPQDVTHNIPHNTDSHDPSTLGFTRTSPSFLSSSNSVRPSDNTSAQDLIHIVGPRHTWGAVFSFQCHHALFHRAHSHIRLISWFHFWWIDQRVASHRIHSLTLRSC